MLHEIPERLQWFTDRIGKRVFRNSDGCDCEMCKAIERNGIHIEGPLHAQYLYDCETDLTADGTPLRYFDSKEGVNEWLKALPNEQGKTA